MGPHAGDSINITCEPIIAADSLKFYNVISFSLVTGAYDQNAKVSKVVIYHKNNIIPYY